MKKRKKRKPLVTPKSKIKSSLRLLWMRSRERAARLKLDQYTCQSCGVKQSRAKGREVYVEVHHKKGVSNWDKIYELIYKYLLCSIEHLETLCKSCHDKEK